MSALARTSVAELASLLRPSLLRLTRLIRSQRVDLSISLTQLSAMHTLAKHGPMSAGELATCEKVQPPSMTKVLATLEERALVRREVSTADRRQVILAITDAGVAVLEDEVRSRDQWLSQRLAALSAEERAVLEAAVPVLDKLSSR
jgi:DNA-binding MarR family transcriptional regulator